MFIQRMNRHAKRFMLFKHVVDYINKLKTKFIIPVWNRVINHSASKMGEFSFTWLGIQRVYLFVYHTFIVSIIYFSGVYVSHYFFKLRTCAPHTLKQAEMHWDQFVSILQNVFFFPKKYNACSFLCSYHGLFPFSTNFWFYIVVIVQLRCSIFNKCFALL